MAEQLDPRYTAVVVIDMQRGAFEGDSERSRLLRASGIAERLADLVRAARARGAMIVYVLNSRREDSADQATLPVQAGPATSRRSVEGTPGWEMADVLHAEASDHHV